jgi:hypothetical protein
MDRKRSRKGLKSICPDIGALLRHRDRTVRAILESNDESGRMFRSTVKWANLMALTDQLF